MKRFNATVPPNVAFKIMVIESQNIQVGTIEESEESE